MDLFASFKIPSDCYLCGCPVDCSSDLNNDLQSNIINVQNFKSQAPILCQYCHQRLPKSYLGCVICGLPSPETPNHAIRLNGDTPCGECLKQSPVYNRMISGFHYEAPISEFITHLKYSAQFQLLPLLCEYLIEKIQLEYNNAKLPSAIIAIPLHSNKLIQRGFNQSQLVASRLAQLLSIKIISKGIYRVKETLAQSGLDSVERRNNVKNAFQISGELPAHIAIIDDVVTTGMTVSEMAKQARLHGSKKIDVWCLARAYNS